MSNPIAKEKNKRKNEEGEKRTLPPMRGQVKSQIFKSFVRDVTYMSAKISKAIVRKLGGEKNSGSSSSTPPPSSYNSDFNSDTS